MKKNQFVASLALCAIVSAAPAFSAALVTSGAGSDAAAITAARDSFRLDIGGGTVTSGAGLFGGIRREINWDAVPDKFSAPNNLPANFFNVNSPRGVVFGTPGSGFQVSANSSSVTPVRFGNIDPSYTNEFQTFSPQKLFTALGSNVTDVNFFVAGTSIPGFTSAFGSVFTDVDLPNSTTLEFFTGASSLGTFGVPNFTTDHSQSFLGVRFDAGERITRVRITSGNAALGAPESGNDLVAMDDFLFAEPRAVPEPSTMVLLAAGLLAVAAVRRRG